VYRFGKAMQEQFIAKKGDDLYKQVTDKLGVREYVKQFDIKTPLLLSSMTDNCVVKANNDSGGIMIIVNGVTVFGSEQTVMKHKHKDWAAHREDHWNYHEIEHKVFCEEYLSGHEIDYQFFCYKGKAGLCQVRNSKRFDNTGHDKTDVAREKVVLRDNTCSPFGIVSKNIYDKSLPTTTTETLNKMWKLADEMSTPFEFVRVDLFLHNNEIYFGEFTFNPMAFNFSRDGDDLLWNNLITASTSHIAEMGVNT
jgi:hypothetical protein